MDVGSVGCDGMGWDEMGKYWRGKRRGKREGGDGVVRSTFRVASCGSGGF